MDGKSLDLKQDKIEKIKEVIPEAFTEGRIDWEKLKASLGEDIEFKNERYVLNWAGKSDAFRVLQAPTTATLAPDRVESVNFGDTENVFIEGENLEVLKVLQKSYFGKIKMIYIDPPYNTGNDHFIYPDRFSETKEEYLGRIGDKDEAGYMTREGLFRKNSKDSGHYHSNWLSMMYPRLFLARNLLKEDGIIFVSIDDNEVHNLRLLMNEVFGEENFVEQLVWKKSYGGGSKSKYVVGLHEYILLYCKNKTELGQIELPPSQEVLKYYKWQDEKHKIRGPYRKQPLATTSMDNRPNLQFPIIWDGNEIWPEKQWQWSKERVESALKNDELVISKRKGKWVVDYKQYLKDENGKIRSSKPYSILEGPYTQIGTGEVSYLFGDGKIFSFPKPSKLIEKLVQYIEEDSIVLDFFAGSCASAQAIIESNRKDNGTRKFICVQLPEKCNEKSEAFKAGYKTIADIGKERIRRVIKKIKDSENGKLPFAKTKQDLGFKVFKLQASNFKIWRGDNIKNGKQLEKQMQLHLDPIKKDATKENMLFELLLKSGRSLNSAIESANDYYRINNGEMVIALSRIDEKIVESILEDKPQVFITLDRLFKNNDQLKTNTLLQMKDAGIEFKVV